MKYPVNDWWNRYVPASEREQPVQRRQQKQPKAHKADCQCSSCRAKQDYEMWKDR